MIKLLRLNRFLIARRVVQIGLLVLFFGANHFGWKVLMGNLSAARVFESFYLADPYAALQMLAAGMLISVDILIGAGIVLVLYVLLFGRAFCSWVCPLNIITDTAHWLRKKLEMNRMKAPLKINRKVRYWVLGLSLVMSALMGVAAFEFVSPISMLHRGVIYGFGMGWLAVCFVFLFDLLILKNGWCGHICPLGAFYSLISPKRMLKVKHDAEKCTDCLDCKVVCPEVQVLDKIGKESGMIHFGACSNCARCIEVCEEDSLFFSIRFFK